MSVAKKSSAILLCLSLAVASVLGVFAIMNASSANASQGEVPPPATVHQPTLIISPTVLEATLYPDGLLTQTLWITNSSEIPITYTIYEMTAPVRQAGFSLDAVAAPLVDPRVRALVASQGKVEAIIYLREKPDLSAASLIPDKATRAQYVYDRLIETATHSQALYDWLAEHGARPRQLWISNAIAATLDASQLATLAANPLVRAITPNRQNHILPSTPGSPFQAELPAPSQPASIEWNILKIRADEAWDTFGVRGEGAVVGIVDTGVMYDHAALVSSYRGNLGGGNFDHNYNWFDFVNGEPVPYDPVGHGTMGAGIISGDDNAGNQIGVAPGAEWIAVRACNTGCTDVDLLAALQWMLAPSDLNGENPDPSKRPDVVLGMWGGSGCDNFFQPSLAALRAAGILPVFSPGGSGPSCATMGSPADMPETLAAGATDNNDVIAPFSSRGPVLCRPELIKPDLAAPGVNIRTSNNNGNYSTTSGTSWSAAHAAGAAALVISADPYLGPVEIESILETTALCLENLSCGGTACPEPNYVYGHGRIDAFEAVSATLVTPPPVDLPWLGEAPISGTLEAGEGVGIEVTFDATGLEVGVYTGALGIASSEPGSPFTSVPVNLNIISVPQPVININPLSFSAMLTIGGTQTDTLSIRNDGDAVLTFTLYEISAGQQLFTPPVEPGIPESFMPEAAAQVEAGVYNQLQVWGQTRLILYLRGQTDFSQAYSITDKATRGQYVYDQLVKTAEQSDDLYHWLLTQGTQPRRLLAANAIAATLDQAQLETVLSFPQVEKVGTNRYYKALVDEHWNEPWQPADLWNLLARAPGPLTIEWNITRIRADETWTTFGITGERASIGIIDTGVMYTHPALVNQYRGNLGDGNFDHNFNWFDVVNGLPAPYDDHSHGTYVAGIAVGDDGQGNQIGVAPGAKWVAVKGLDAGGGTTEEDLHAALQWMLAPTDLAGNNPDPGKAPNAVLNAWRWYACTDTFDTDLLALRAANILPVFAGGHDGPGCGLVVYPAANPNTLAAGATGMNDLILNSSGKGPSCVDNSIKPDVVAPGENIRSSINNGDYEVWSGTSASSAHLAGAAALLFSADPGISIDVLEQTLFDTAACHNAQYFCFGDNTCPGANNSYGYGRIDVFEAVSATLGSAYDVPWLTAGPLAGELQAGGSHHHCGDLQCRGNAAGHIPGRDCH